MPRAIASIVIPNWNGGHHLRICLPALRQQSEQSFELIVVDNGSTDDSEDIVHREIPEARFIKLSRNFGFARACNEGIIRAKGKHIALLNNDTEPEAGWLAALIGRLESDPELGSVASKLLVFDRRHMIHSAGDYYRIDGVPGNRGVWQADGPEYDQPAETFSACAGAAAYRREMFEQVGLFDEEFVSYCEDVDLGFRAQLAGWRCGFEPGARVYHRISASGSGELASYYNGRNFVLVMAKNYPRSLLRRNIGKIVKAQLGFLGESLRHWREPAARARIGGQLAGLAGIPGVMGKRRIGEQLRRISDEDLLARMSAAG